MKRPPENPLSLSRALVCRPLAAGPLLLQHDCPALIKANNAERVLADVDANPRCPICNVNHGGVCSYMVAGLKPNASTGPNTKAERD